MELIIISRTKLKVMLSAEDMKQIADFKSVVKSYLKMDMLLKK